MTPLDAAVLAARAYADAPTVGQNGHASVMHVYGTAHVFRGTDDIDGWLHDLDITTSDVSGLGSVESGFWQALADILPACLALPRPQYVIGHSLGAAMAILYAGVLQLLGTIVRVFAFEPPRLCADKVLFDLNQANALPWYASRNGRDVVTQIPPELSLPGPLTMIGTPELPFDNVLDHRIDSVIAALRAANTAAPS